MVGSKTMNFLKMLIKYLLQKKYHFQGLQLFCSESSSSNDIQHVKWAVSENHQYKHYSEAATAPAVIILSYQFSAAKPLGSINIIQRTGNHQRRAIPPQDTQTIVEALWKQGKTEHCVQCVVHKMQLACRFSLNIRWNNSNQRTSKRLSTKE